MTPIPLGTTVQDKAGRVFVYIGYRVNKSGNVEHRFHMAYPDAMKFYLTSVYCAVFKETLVNKFPALIRYPIAENAS